MIIVFSQCSAPKIAMSDPSLAQQEFKVEGRQGLLLKQKLKFGDYHTTSVKRSWTRTESNQKGWGPGRASNALFSEVLTLDKINKSQSLRFEMEDNAGGQSEVYCMSRFNSQNLRFGKNPNSVGSIAMELFLKTSDTENSFYVQLYTNQFDRPWELLLDNEAWQAQSNTYQGLLSQDKENYYTLVPITHMLTKNGKAGKILFGSIGFEFRDKNNKAVAAVSTIDKGLVYLGNISPKEKFLIANACAAILMQEQLGG